MLTGCASVADIAGAVAGVASGAITANPAVAIGVGIAVHAGATQAANRVALHRQRNEQDAIAAAIADAAVGETRAWGVDQHVTGDAYGEVRVVRLIETPLALCKEALFSVVEGEGDAADNIVGGPEHSTLSNDAFPSRTFDFMLANPPYGKSWKSDMERMGGKDGLRDPRFKITHANDAATDRTYRYTVLG